MCLSWKFSLIEGKYPWGSLDIINIGDKRNQYRDSWLIKGSKKILYFPSSGKTLSRSFIIILSKNFWTIRKYSWKITLKYYLNWFKFHSVGSKCQFNMLTILIWKSLKHSEPTRNAASHALCIIKKIERIFIQIQSCRVWQSVIYQGWT